MGSVYSFEKTSMIQPDAALYENYQATKMEMKKIKEGQHVENMRLTILQEANERLNAEVQRLKKALASSHKAHTPAPQPSMQSQVAEAKLYREKIQRLEMMLAAEKKKTEKLNANVVKLEKLLDEVYEAEKEVRNNNAEVDSIKKVNQQLLNMLQRLNQS